MVTHAVKYESSSYPHLVTFYKDDILTVFSRESLKYSLFYVSYVKNGFYYYFKFFVQLLQYQRLNLCCGFPRQWFDTSYWWYKSYTWNAACTWRYTAHGCSQNKTCNPHYTTYFTLTKTDWIYSSILSPAKVSRACVCISFLIYRQAHGCQWLAQQSSHQISNM